MKKNILSKNTLGAIIGGIVLIGVGVAGFLNPKIHEFTSLRNYSYRIISLEIDHQAESEFTFVVTPSENVAVDTKMPREDPGYLNTGIAYIHSDFNSHLESPLIPSRIAIPSINLDAPVLSADFHQQQIGEDYFGLWEAPDSFAAGWHPDSALLGEIGNTVINGHHNINGMVFQNLVNLNIGDKIIVFAGDRAFTYTVNNRLILPELYIDVEERRKNARWLSKSDDERLTLVTCWPANSNTHRLIIVAEPVRSE